MSNLSLRGEFGKGEQGSFNLIPMDVFVLCVLMALCLCILTSCYVFLSYAVYVILWKN
jgi:hypothetical protein